MTKNQKCLFCLDNEHLRVSQQSKPVAIFSKQTDWTLQRAMMNKLKNLILAKFISSPKKEVKLSIKLLFL